jgi:hypothetical protein
MTNQFIIQEYDVEDKGRDLEQKTNLAIITGKIISFFNGVDWWFNEIVDRESGTEEFQFLRKQSIIEIPPKEKDCVSSLLSTGGLNLIDKKVTNHCFLINIKLEDNIPYYILSLGYPDMMIKRCLHNLINVRDKYFLAIGGKNDNEWLSSCEMFNYESKKWEPFPNLNSARSNFDSILINNNVFVFGGFCSKDVFSENPIEFFNFNSNDIKNNKWEIVKTTNSFLSLACSRLYKTTENRLIILGGCDKNSTNKYIYQFDPDNNNISKLGELNFGRTNFHYLGINDTLYIVGGSFKLEYSGKNYSIITNFIEKINLNYMNDKKELQEFNCSEQLTILENYGNEIDKQYYDHGFSLSASLIIKETTSIN